MSPHLLRTRCVWYARKDTNNTEILIKQMIWVYLRIVTNCFSFIMVWIICIVQIILKTSFFIRLGLCCFVAYEDCNHISQLSTQHCRWTDGEEMRRKWDFFLFPSVEGACQCSYMKSLMQGTITDKTLTQNDMTSAWNKELGWR